MYSTLLIIHSLIRWLVLAFLLYSICTAFVGYTRNKRFSKVDNASRHWTATVSHIQLMIGIILYTQSPIVNYFWAKTEAGLQQLELTFYGLIHIVLMLLSVVLITIGSALGKRRLTDKEKFKTMFVWFSIAFIIILIVIPWPFSPLSSRPHFRMF